MYTVFTMLTDDRSVRATFGETAIRIFISLAFVSSLSCVSTRNGVSVGDASKPEPAPLVLTFTGDIMAHSVNFNMTDYDLIYRDIRDRLHSDDITFGNLETPVYDSRPLSTWPRFNVHRTYLEAAIRGGFDSFSLANNHSNDQGVKGIAATLSAFGHVSKNAAFANRVSHSGLKLSRDEAIKPVLIERRGRRVLFLAVTEILNSFDGSKDFVYYVAPTESSRAAFLAEIARMRAEYPCDVFVLSIHCDEPEYVREPTADKRRWFRSLAEAGADVVWGNHPHVMQPWEVVRVSGRDRDALLMYSMGNFVSGQRFELNTGNPASAREYTGDSVLMRVTFGGESGALDVEVVPVTNYTDPGVGVVVREFTGAFVDSLSPALRRYYEKRYALMASYLPLLPLRPDTAILE